MQIWLREIIYICNSWFVTLALFMIMKISEEEGRLRRDEEEQKELWKEREQTISFLWFLLWPSCIHHQPAAQQVIIDLKGILIYFIFFNNLCLQTDFYNNDIKATVAWQHISWY